MHRRLIGLTALPFLLFGCAAQGPGDDTIDQARLAEYRNALPSSETLRATAPRATTQTALGDPAILPHSSWPIVAGINGTVAGTIALLDMVVEQPPSFYDSQTKEFVWGPYPDEVGYVAAYIRDVKDDPDADFDYHFAFLRGATNDLATLTPVVWGGASPDPDAEDRGIGVTLWDFEAARAFYEEHDPGFDPAAHDQGRFAALYGKGPAEDDPANEATWVVAVFRDFVSKDDPGEPPVDLDYLYGRYETPSNVIDFLDYQAPIDVSDPEDDVREDVGVRMVFFDEGTGRAEADAINGSLEANHRVDVVECWDTSLAETYLLIEERDGANVVGSYETGQPGDCGFFDTTLDSLDIPSLQDIDPELLAVLDEVATTGAPPSE